MYIDTHCHLDSSEFDSIDEIMKRVENNIIIVSGYTNEANHEVIELCNKYSNVYGTIGIHPNEIDDNIDSNLKFIEQNLNHSKIVGIGEIGLDYHWDTVDRELQKKYFRKQIEIALKNQKTIVIHSRDAESDTYSILREYDLSKSKIVMHCYGYSLEMANKLIKWNVKFGIGGVLTFKNSKKLKNIVEKLDIKHLVLETDCPYLTPEPYRGQKNEPSYIVYVAEELAKIKHIPFEKVLEITTNNAISQFDLNDKL